MAGTIVQTHYLQGTIKKVHFACTADAADGGFPDTVLTTPIEGFLLMIETNPGTTSPTDNYDVTLIDEQGVDKLNSYGLNRDEANTEIKGIVLQSFFHPVVCGDEALTLKIANNSVNNATTQVIIYYSVAAD